MKAIACLCGALVLAVAGAVHAQATAPKQPRSNCTQAKDRKACEARRKLCAQSGDPAKCEANAKRRLAHRRK